MQNILAFIDQNLQDNGNNAIPEIKALRNIIEDNPWHKNQSVFDHTKAVVEALKKYTRDELLLLAALFHDVAKPETLVMDSKSKQTICPDHEQIGSKKIREIGKRIGLKENEIQYLEYVIANHGATHEMINCIVARGGIELFFENFLNKHKKIGHDLLLLALADTEGCSLQMMNSKEYKKRIETMSGLITKES